MLRSLLTAEKYIERLEEMVSRFGANRLLKCKDVVVFYSGPSDEVIQTIGFDPLLNWERSIRLASALEASRIDDTIFGATLFKRDLGSYFETAYAHEPKPKASARAAYSKVCVYISDRFSRGGFKHVATVVCGADSSRVFIKYELPALMENPNIQTINGIVAKAVKEMYTCVGKDEAFNLICRSELKALHERILTPSKTSPEFELDYKDQLLFYQTERAETEKDNASKGAPRLTTKQEEEKQRIIKTFGLEAIYNALPKATISSPSKPITPAGSCPTPLYPYIH